MEGMSSLLVAQRLGQVGKELVGEGEAYQFGLLVAAAAAYVASAFWVVVVRLSRLALLDWLLKSWHVVLSCDCRLAALLHSAWCCADHIGLPHVHWIRATPHERDRD